MLKVTTNTKDLIVLMNNEFLCFFGNNTIANSNFQTDKTKSTTSEIFELDLETLSDNATFSVIITDYDQAVKNLKSKKDFLNVEVKIELPKEEYEVNLKEVIEASPNGKIEHYCNAVWLWEIKVDNGKKKIHVEHKNKQFQLTSIEADKILELYYLKKGFNETTND